MPVIIVTKPFPFAINGNQVVQIEAGEQEVSERCALVAVDHLKAAVWPGEAKPESRQRSRK